MTGEDLTVILENRAEQARRYLDDLQAREVGYQPFLQRFSGRNPVTRNVDVGRSLFRRFHEVILSQIQQGRTELIGDSARNIHTVFWILNRNLFRERPQNKDRLISVAFPPQSPLFPSTLGTSPPPLKGDFRRRSWRS